MLIKLDVLPTVVLINIPDSSTNILKVSEKKIRSIADEWRDAIKLKGFSTTSQDRLDLFLHKLEEHGIEYSVVDYDISIHWR